MFFSFYVSHLAVSLIPKLHLEDLRSFGMSGDSSHKLYQSSFTTSNRTLEQYRFLGGHGQGQSSQIAAGWVNQHQILLINLQVDANIRKRERKTTAETDIWQRLHTCSGCLGTILGSTTPQTATTFCDKSSDTTWPLVNLLAFSWHHVT